MKRFPVVVLALVLLLSMAAVAGAFCPTDDPLDCVELQMSCPGGVNAGQSLDVTVTFENWGCSQANVARIMKGLLGNGDNTAGGIGVFGPYYQAVWYQVPAGTGGGCGSGGSAGTPGTFGPVSVQIVGSVPASLGGAAALTSVAVTDYKGEVFGGDECSFDVWP